MTTQAQDFSLYQLAADLGAQLHERQWHLATAESCTGGGIATAVTAVPGSSKWFEYGLVTYGNQAKTSLLKVDPSLIEQKGAVSQEVVEAMVQGVLELSGAELAVSVSGVAGPGGGTDEKPVGTVWFSWATSGGWQRTQCYDFTGDRAKIRRQSVVVALRELLAIASDPKICMDKQ